MGFLRFQKFWTQEQKLQNTSAPPPKKKKTQNMGLELSAVLDSGTKVKKPPPNVMGLCDFDCGIYNVREPVWIHVEDASFFKNLTQLVCIGFALTFRVVNVNEEVYFFPQTI